jgi:hypothetical protein
MFGSNTCRSNAYLPPTSHIAQPLEITIFTCGKWHYTQPVPWAVPPPSDWRIQHKQRRAKMPIPFIIVGGARVELDFVGYTARTCRYCGVVQAFKCYARTRSEHLYGVTLLRGDDGMTVVCDLCQVSSRIRESESVQVHPSWDPSRELQELIDGTNPGLHLSADSLVPGERQITALFLVIQQRTSMGSVNIKPGLVLGGLVGGLIFFAFSYIETSVEPASAHPNAFAYIFTLTLLGIAIGVTVGSVWWFRVNSRRLTKALLISSMEKHGLTAPQLRVILARKKAFGYGRVRRALIELSRPGVAQRPAGGRASAPQEPGRVTCPQCNLINPLGVAACRRCGAPLA